MQITPESARIPRSATGYPVAEECVVGNILPDERGSDADGRNRKRGETKGEWQSNIPFGKIADWNLSANRRLYRTLERYSAQNDRRAHHSRLFHFPAASRFLHFKRGCEQSLKIPAGHSEIYRRNRNKRDQGRTVVYRVFDPALEKCKGQSSH